MLFREKLLVERGLLQLAAGVTDRLREPAEVNAKELGAEKMRSGRFGMALKSVPRIVTLLGMTLMASAFRARSDGHGERSTQRATPARDVHEDRAVLNATRTRPFDQVEEAENERAFS